MTVKPAQFDLLQQLLTLSDTRHRVISQNIANVNTPGYRRLDVSFDESLAKLLAEGGEDSQTPLDLVIEESGGGTARADGNNVDIDRELGGLSKNALLYQTYAQVLTSRLGMMRAAITGR